MQDTRSLPLGAQKYSSSPIFKSGATPERFFKPHASSEGSLKTVPAALLDVHNLKAGTWGLLNVQAGTVEYYLEAGRALFRTVKAGETLVILPEERHYISICDNAVFFIEFFKATDTAAQGA